jgi:hypothetical protein
MTDERAAVTPPHNPAPTPANGSARAFQYAALVPWTAQFVAAAILLQTLYFKFTYAPETRHIFARLGGRPAATLAGLVELAAVILLLIPRTAAVGAVLALGVIGGALVTHLALLGVVVVDPETGEGDGGLLFGLALVVAAAALVVLWYRWSELPSIGWLRARA